jgi:hypothetical protein
MGNNILMPSLVPFAPECRASGKLATARIWSHLRPNTAPSGSHTAAPGAESAGHQVEPDPAEMARRYGAETPVPDWRNRLVCSRCGSHDTDMVVTGERR